MKMNCFGCMKSVTLIDRLTQMWRIYFIVIDGKLIFLPFVFMFKNCKLVGIRMEFMQSQNVQQFNDYIGFKVLCHVLVHLLENFLR